jgi:hypothetical protein
MPSVFLKVFDPQKMIQIGDDIGLVPLHPDTALLRDGLNQFRTNPAGKSRDDFTQFGIISDWHIGYRSNFHLSP